ncbi:hypothetical protein B0H12DRAFT_1081024 [Mycena haematopus]|nr:hypothetical protein B0H12DRAFT_1083224 [Mycena haematopus]KAJ7201503.1 hypothetical protein B0H12DRAFT_1081024 [Mycena haematopus]
MAPTTTFFSTRDVDTSSDSAVPTPAPSVPIWVAYVVAFLVLCAILVLCYFLRKNSLVWVERVRQLNAEPKEKISAQSLKRLKVISGRATSTTSPPPPGYTGQIKESVAQRAVDASDHSIAPAPPAYVKSAEGVRLPDSRYALGHITRFNTLKNQRDAAQVFAKPHRTVDAAPLPPTLCPAEAHSYDTALEAPSEYEYDRI